MQWRIQIGVRGGGGDCSNPTTSPNYFIFMGNFKETANLSPLPQNPLDPLLTCVKQSNIFRYNVEWITHAYRVRKHVEVSKNYCMIDFSCTRVRTWTSCTWIRPGFHVHAILSPHTQAQTHAWKIEHAVSYWDDSMYPRPVRMRIPLRTESKRIRIIRTRISADYIIIRKVSVNWTWMAL